MSTHFRHATTVKHITVPSRRLARLAVITLELVSKTISLNEIPRFSSETMDKTSATNGATNPTEDAWHWTRAMLPKMIERLPLVVSRSPRLLCVDRREASVISTLPLRPSKGCTRMNSCGMFLNTDQVRTCVNMYAAATFPSPARRKATINSFKTDQIVSSDLECLDNWSVHDSES